MSKEIPKNWKEGLIAEYARLENEIAIEMNEMGTDPDLIKLMKEQAKLNDMIALAKGIYAKTIETARQQQVGIKAELVDRWLSTEDKSFECGAGTATLRTNRSLVIRSKVKLIEFLVLNKKLVDFIKTFDIVKLRKIKDAGMLGDEIATYDEGQSIAIKLAEAGQ